MAEEAIAKARAIAARLAGGGAISTGDSAGGELGKRKRWDTQGDDQGGRPAGYAGCNKHNNILNIVLHYACQYLNLSCF